MILPSIENFLKILHFYQLNDVRTVKEKSKKRLKNIISYAKRNNRPMEQITMLENLLFEVQNEM